MPDAPQDETPPTDILKVVIADDHPLVLAGFSALIGQRPEFAIVAECGDGETALRMIAQHLPDLAVLDLNMPGLDGLDVLRRLQALPLPTKAVLISASLTAEQVGQASALGAVGIVRKDAAPEELIECLLQVAAGGIWLSTDGREPAKLEHPPEITAREGEVIALAIRGHSNKEIARRLQLSEGTVKIHMYNIFRKLGVKNRTELANRYLRS
jgi:DNA-binding NarL/FixJ family response regulator